VRKAAATDVPSVTVKQDDDKPGAMTDCCTLMLLKLLCCVYMAVTIVTLVFCIVLGVAACVFFQHINANFVFHFLISMQNVVPFD